MRSTSENPRTAVSAAPGANSNTTGQSHFTAHGATVATLLDRLDGVKSTGRGRFIACCPAHADKRPSLSICETDDGVILLKCWVGCSAAEIVSAVGLNLSALFPPRERHGKSLPRSARPRLGTRELLDLLGQSVAVVWIAATDLANGKQLDPQDFAALKRVVGELGRVVTEARNGH